MKIADSVHIGAAPAVVWRAMNDPEVLRDCIPGCESLEREAENRFTAAIRRKIGPVQARFTGAIELSDIVEGVSYTISGEGSGGAAGSARGSAEVRLEAEAGGTRLAYAVEVQIRGRIAQLGSRLITAFARSSSRTFFANFCAALEPPEAAEAAAAAPG